MINQLLKIVSILGVGLCRLGVRPLIRFGSRSVIIRGRQTLAKDSGLHFAL